jgi:thioredoxin reductase
LEACSLFCPWTTIAYTAYIVTCRQGLNTLLITKDIGGQALLTNEIENYPAFDHIGGYELMTKFESQLEILEQNLHTKKLLLS